MQRFPGPSHLVLACKILGGVMTLGGTLAATIAFMSPSFNAQQLPLSRLPFSQRFPLPKLRAQPRGDRLPSPVRPTPSSPVAKPVTNPVANSQAVGDRDAAPNLNIRLVTPIRNSSSNSSSNNNLSNRNSARNSANRPANQNTNHSPDPSAETRPFQNTSQNLGKPRDRRSNQRDTLSIPDSSPLPEVPLEPSEDLPIVTLADVIYLALENNIEIKNTYLDRLAQRSVLNAIESKFTPRFTPQFTVNLDPIRDRARRGNGSITSKLEALVTMQFPTGGNLTFGWTGDALSQDGSNPNDVFRQGYRVELSQPLLRGAGNRLATLDIQLARLIEQSNIQALRATLIDKITEVILAYRQLLQSQQQVIIDQQSLQSAQQALTITQALIQAGRRAPVDIVQNQANVANRRVALLAAENALASQRVALLRLLDLPDSRRFSAEAIADIPTPNLEPDRLLDIVRTTPAQRQAQLAVERDRLDLLLAQDSRRWDISLKASLTDTTNQPSDARVAISASRTLGDRTLDQRLKQAEVDLQKSENLAQRAQQQANLDVRDRIRDINLSFNQLNLARQALRLAVQQLEIEQQKFRLGKSNTLDVIQLQEQLTQSRASESRAVIEYLNSLTRLDQTLGTTLETWQIRGDRVR